MKLLKLLPLLLMFVFFNTNAHAAKDCAEIKGNIVGKLFCKAQSNMNTGSGSNSSETIVSAESTGKKKWKLWSRPEWTKKKN